MVKRSPERHQARYLLEPVAGTAPVPVFRDGSTGFLLAYDCRAKAMVRIGESTLTRIRFAAEGVTESREAVVVIPEPLAAGVLDWCILYGGRVLVRLRTSPHRRRWADVAHCFVEIPSVLEDEVGLE